MSFKKANKQKVRLRLALSGPTKAGKSWTGLAIACGLAKALGTRVAAIDSESGRLLLYANRFDFDHDALEDFNPANYVAKINEAVKSGYGVILIDGITQEWSGKGGVLEIVDTATTKSGNNNKYTSGWSVGTPAHNALIQAINNCPSHVIVTMRSKMDYVLEKKNGKDVPRKIGMAPIQREETPYEFDVLIDMDLDHNGTVTGTRAEPFPTGMVIEKPGGDVAEKLLAWLNDGEDAATVDHMAEAKAIIAALMSVGDDPEATEVHLKRKAEAEGPRLATLPPHLQAQVRQAYVQVRDALAKRQPAKGAA